MSEALVYIGKVFLIQALFYGFYKLLLKRSQRHSWNRFYLLAALIISFGVPFIESPYQKAIEPLNSGDVITWVQESAMEYELTPIIHAPESTFNYWSMLPWLYGAIVCYLISRSVAYLFILQKLKKHSEYVKKQWFKLFKITQPRPFSFFSNVFIPEQIFGTSSFDQILAHECVHVKQRHSYDRLLMDFLVSLFWFNPFIYLYRNALIEIHEFQADEAVINQFNDPIGYQEVLYSQLQHATYSGLVSHFNVETIKKRIVMMNKQKNKYAGLLYALTLPVLVSVIFAFSTKEAIEPIEHVGNELAEILSPEPSFKLPTFNLSELKGHPQQEDNVPSILPLREADLVRMTSGFGKRMHPIYKVEKWHLGMDFSCPNGSEILATANGVVESIDEKPEGYGKVIIINHGNEYKTRYAQLSEFKVKEGDQVKMSDVIALSGNSGMSTAPHLHYEVQKGDKRVDPMDYIKDYDFKRRINEIKTSQTKKNQQEEALRKKEEALAFKELELAKKEEALAKKALEQADKLNEQELKKAKLELLRAEEERERAEMEKKMKEVKVQFTHDEGSTINLPLGEDSPLYILDGKEVSDVTDLETDQIERIDVLKGDKAKEKYGEKGKKGVIEIKTKDKQKSKGKEKPKSQSEMDELSEPYIKDGFFTMIVENPKERQINVAKGWIKTFGDKVIYELRGDRMIVYIADDIRKQVLAKETIETNDSNEYGHVIRFDLAEGSSNRKQIMKAFEAAKETYGKDKIRIKEFDDYLEVISSKAIIAIVAKNHD